MKRLSEIKNEMLDSIKKAVLATPDHKINLGEMGYDSCPILQESDNDEETYTLDSIYIGKDGKIFFDGSSSWDNHTWNELNISTDALEGICEELEFIVDAYNDYLKELAEDEGE